MSKIDEAIELLEGYNNECPACRTADSDFHKTSCRLGKALALLEAAKVEQTDSEKFRKLKQALSSGEIDAPEFLRRTDHLIDRLVAENKAKEEEILEFRKMERRNYFVCGSCGQDYHTLKMPPDCPFCK